MELKTITTYQAITLYSVLGRATKRIMTDFLADYQITMNEWLMLGSVVDAGKKGVRNTQIAKSLNIEMPVVTKIVKKCEDDGLFEVVNDSKDGRAKKVKATKKAIDTVNDIESKIQQGMQEWFKGIEEEKLIAYMEVLKFQADKAREI